MKNIDKFSNTKDAIKAYEIYKNENRQGLGKFITFKDWLEKGDEPFKYKIFSESELEQMIEKWAIEQSISIEEVKVDRYTFAYITYTENNS